MTQPTTCKYCRSTDVPADLVCVRMCERCCAEAVDVTFMDLGPIRSALRRRQLGRQRRDLVSA